MARNINKEICVGCGACERTCLTGCISEKENRKREVNVAGCVDCGACQLVCPVGAITAI